MMDKSRLISVIMPAYNASLFIGEAIESVIQQTYTEWELVIIDDGSTDSTCNVVEPFLRDNRIRLIKQQNSGVSKARNTGVCNASGQWIAFLDADDLWLPQKLHLQMKCAEENRDLALVHTSAFRFRARLSEAEPISNPVYDKSDPYKSLLMYDFIITSSVMVSKECIKAVGCFDENLFGPEDWDLWIRIAKDFKIYKVDMPLVYYREHPEGISKNYYRQFEQRMKVMKRYVLNSKCNRSSRLKKKALWYFWNERAYCEKRSGNKMKMVLYSAIMFVSDPLESKNYCLMFSKTGKFFLGKK